MKIKVRKITEWNSWELVLLISVVLLSSLLIGTAVAGRGAISKGLRKEPVAPLAVPDPIHLSNTFAAVIENVEPAVVNISATQIHKPSHGLRRPRGFEDPFWDFWNRFDLPESPVAEHSLGLGVIVDKKGYILTNRHVVGGATKIQVQLNGDGKRYSAERWRTISKI